MAYLDEDILYINVEEKYKSAKGEARAAYSDVLDTICEMPRADVVPKSEVESMSHKCENCAGCTQWVCECSLIEEHAKTEVAREIFEEIEKLIIRRMIADSPLIDDRLITDIAELKKKYTENTK